MRIAIKDSTVKGTLKTVAELAGQKCSREDQEKFLAGLQTDLPGWIMGKAKRVYTPKPSAN